jgi:hypothetical protein
VIQRDGRWLTSQSVREFDVLVEHDGPLFVADDVVAVQAVAVRVEVVFALRALIALAKRRLVTRMLGLGPYATFLFRSKVLCPPDGACHADATMRGRLATRHAALDGFQHVVADIVADPVG